MRMISRKKKGVSEMIGYILLITFAVVISVFVYQWLKTYVPKDSLKCPGDVSIYISDSEIDTKTNELKLTLVNNGKFGIAGFFIYYSASEDEEIATNDLSGNLSKENTAIKLNNAIMFKPEVGEKNPFLPGDDSQILKFNVNGIAKIYSIEIIPIRMQEQKNREFPVSCGDAKTKEIIDKVIGSGGEEIMT